MTEPSPIRILLVDDHSLFRKGIASLLTAERGFEVAGEAGDGLEALTKAREVMPDLILMDISMPGMNGLEATRRIKEVLPYVKIVILTISEEDQDLFEAIKSGAQGYLLKKIEAKALFSTLRGIVQGEASVSRAMAAKILDEFARQARRQPAVTLPGTNLSPREKKVLELVAHGKTNKEIAAALAIAENTVKSYVKNILEKLHLENRVQAATFAVREGLIEKPTEKSG
jgi:two-component system nitrate/nitrite response regulator NarL